jgi:protein NrfD
VERIQTLLFLVLGQLAVGGTFLLALPSLQTVGISFYRTNGIVFWLTLLLGIFIGGGSFSLLDLPSLSPALCFYLLFAVTLFLYNLRLWFRHPFHSSRLLFSAGVFGTAGMLLALYSYLPGLSFSRAVWLSFYSVISSLLLGSGVLAMLLGHSYLTRPTLSIVPLHHFSLLFMGLVFTEGGCAILNLIVAAQSAPIWEVLKLKTFEGLYLWIRLAIGIVGPAILAPMILATVRERSTMAATGLLYVAMLMVILGALFSRFFLLINNNLL